MPELPEVQTTVNGLQSKVLNRTFVGIWTDWEKIARLRSSKGGTKAGQVNRPKDFSIFEKELKNKKILKVWRRAKNVIFELSDGYSLLVHMKMTGHLMVGKWKLQSSVWQPIEHSPFEEKINGYIRFVWFLDDGRMIVLSDLRKFAKVELWKTQELLQSKEFLALGPEPLEKSFTFSVFKKALQGKRGKASLRQRLRRGKVKQVIMVPEVIAGIGNIYASEALWWAKIHPEKSVAALTDQELRRLYAAIKKVLLLGVQLGGESFADYRNVDGEPGHFYQERKAYKREKQPCFRCDTPLQRVMFGGRSAFFCPACQKS